MITFRVMGQPVGKARPRVTRAGRVYTPTKTSQAEQDIRAMATYVMCGEPPIEGPVELGVTFTMDVPVSWTKTKRQQAYAQQIKPAAKPDIDNLIKTVMDACNGVTYADDAQVVRITATKRYRTDCEAPMTTVRIIPV